MTTMLGGGTGPAHGTFATTCTPGAWNLHRMLEAADQGPDWGDEDIDENDIDEDDLPDYRAVIAELRPTRDPQLN